MRRWIWMLAALVLLAVLPNGGTELGELRPAAVLAVWQEDTQVVLETDTGDVGRGGTLELALENLRQTTPGNVFLETVEDLLVSEQTRRLLPDLQKLLRPGVRVCVAEPMDLESVWEYLKIHTPKAILSDSSEATKLQTLNREEERYVLEGEGGTR